MRRGAHRLPDALSAREIPVRGDPLAAGADLADGRALAWAFGLNYLAYLSTRGYVIADKNDDKGFCLYFRLSARCARTCIKVLPGFFPPGGRTRGIRVDGVDRSENLIPTNAKDFQIQSRASAKPAELVVEFMKFPG